MLCGQDPWGECIMLFNENLVNRGSCFCKCDTCVHALALQLPSVAWYKGYQARSYWLFTNPLYSARQVALAHYGVELVIYCFMQSSSSFGCVPSMFHADVVTAGGASLSMDSLYAAAVGGTVAAPLVALRAFSWTPQGQKALPQLHDVHIAQVGRYVCVCCLMTWTPRTNASLPVLNITIGMLPDDCNTEGVCWENP